MYRTHGATEPAHPAGFSTSRCLRGELAFLAVTLRDTDTGQDCTDDREGPRRTRLLAVAR